MLYLIQATVYSALLYAVYVLILKNRASHTLSRVYLLLCAVLPIVIPFAHLPEVHSSIPVNTDILNSWLPEVTVHSNAHAVTTQLNWFWVIRGCYTLISASILSIFLIQYISFKRFTRQHTQEKTDNNVIVLLNTNAGPGSFGNYIFLPATNTDPAVYEHELAHIRLKHSADIIFMRLLQTFFWPNVMLYVINKELKVVHEFQADEPAIKYREAYVTSLLNDAFGTNRFALSHTFFYHPLKRRIMMLQKSPLSRKKLQATMLKTGVLAAIIVTGVIYLQSCNTQTAKAQTPSGAEPQMIAYDTISQGKIIGHRMVYNTAELMPETKYSIAEFIAANIKYPEKARKMGIQGRVIVKFVVDEKGNITQPEIVNSPDSTLSAEALRVVSKMPSWIPGKKDGKEVAIFTYLPISFKLDDNKNTSTPSGEITATPNPASGSFTIKGPVGKTASEKVTISVADLNGRIVYEQTVTTTKGAINESIKLDPKAPNGMYNVNVRSVSASTVLHVLVQK